MVLQIIPKEHHLIFREEIEIFISTFSEN
jgi:hypothetical protein